MSKTGSFLWKLFCAIVMFFYHKPSDADTKTVSLCQNPNQYVVSCKDIEIGTEWLKGATFNRKKTVLGKTIGPWDVEPFYDETQIELSDEEKSIALRYFLDTAAGTQNHPTGSEELEQVLNKIDELDTFNAEDVLTLLCSDPSRVECATCPDGRVADSLFKYDDSNMTIITGSWKIYTIADCYKYEFANATGTYSYYSDSSENPYKFYYDISKGGTTGSYLYYK